MKAFLTGSHAYGIPHEHSDVDLVVFLDSEDDFLRLLSEAEKTDGSGSKEQQHSLHFGKLNLICPDSLEEYNAWKEATEELKAAKPVTRERAVEVIHEYLEKTHKLEPGIF